MMLKFKLQTNLEAYHGVKSTHVNLSFLKDQIIEPIGVADDLWDSNLLTVTYKSYIFSVEKNLIKLTD